MPESTQEMQPRGQPPVAHTRTHTRTHSWDDPAPMPAALPLLSGLALLGAIGDGSLPRPPIMSTLDIAPVEAEEGRVVFVLEPGPHHLNPLGTIHGGVLSALLDTAAACAVHSTLPAGTGYTTLDLSVRFLRPVTPETGTVRAEGVLVSRGRRTALAEARAYDSSDRLLAHATSTCLILDLTAG